MAFSGANIYGGPQNPGAGTVMPEGTQWQRFNQLRYLSDLKLSQQALQAQQAEKQRSDMANEMKAVMDKGVSVQFAPYRKTVAEMSKAAQDKNLEVLNKSQGRPTQEEKNAIAENWRNVEYYAKGVNAINTDITNYIANIDKNSPIDKNQFFMNISKQMTNEDGSLKDPYSVDIQDVIKKAESDPSSYDMASVNEGFMNSITEEVNAFAMEGGDTREEYTVKSKLVELDANGDPIPDPETNQWKLKITPELVMKYKGTKPGKAILDGTVREMYDQGFEGSIGKAERQALDTIIRADAYRNVSSRNVENQPRTGSGSGSAAEQARNERKDNRLNSLYEGVVNGNQSDLDRAIGGNAGFGTITAVRLEDRGLNPDGTIRKELVFEYTPEGDKRSPLMGNKKQTKSFPIDGVVDLRKAAIALNKAIDDREEAADTRIGWDELSSAWDNQMSKTSKSKPQQATAKKSDPLGIL